MLLLAHFNISKNEIKKKGVEKEMMWGICIGIVLGALLMNLAVEEENRINEILKKVINNNEILKKVINNLEEDLKNANIKVENRDCLIKDLKKEEETLLKNAEELRSKIVDLENNLNLVTNSLKELAYDWQSRN